MAACADRAHHLTSSRHARRSSPGNPDSNAPTWQVGNVADHLTRTQVRPNMVLHPCLCGVPPGWWLRVRGGQVRTRWVISVHTTSAPARSRFPNAPAPHTVALTHVAPPHNLSIRPVSASKDRAIASRRLCWLCLCWFALGQQLMPCPTSLVRTRRMTTVPLTWTCYLQPSSRYGCTTMSLHLRFP